VNFFVYPYLILCAAIGLLTCVNAAPHLYQSNYNFDETKDLDMNIFTLRNKLSTLLMTALMVMALSMMTGCSSSGDSDDSASGSSADDAAIEENCKAETDNLDDFEICVRENTP
jgi:hypothetical protein